MGEEISNFASISFYEKGSDKPIFTVDDASELFQSNVFETVPVVNLNRNNEKEISFNIENVDADLMKKLLTPETDISYKCEITGKYGVQVQARKHKSKRINKKWLKKYGYKLIWLPFSTTIPKCYIKDMDQNELIKF